VVLDVRPPDSVRHYRYALDFRSQPRNARTRLIGLAVAEAVDASRIELTAVPEPRPAPAPAPIAAPVAVPPASGWTVSVVVNQRSFHTRGGADLLGGGVAPSRRLSTHVHLAADVVAEAATAFSPSGVVTVRSLSSAARVTYRTGGHAYGELGIGARLGVARLRGTPVQLSPVAAAGTTITRVWLGPAATAALAVDLTPRIAVAATLELGLAITDATARDLGEPVAALAGAWASLGFAAVIAL
jgi:hypothetical protein